ncbi:MAG: transporter, partial [Solirubrobacterales bacterium]|nr:transporter [Solirubrobacterales bacterium]
MPARTESASATPQPGEGGPVDTRRAWKVLALTSVAVLLAFLDVTIVNTAFPAICATFPGTSIDDLSWVLNAYNVVFAALLIPAGRLADRAGRRRVFFGGLGVFVVGSLLCGLAPTAELLIAARVLQAAGAAALIPASLGLALPEFPPERRAV